MTFKKINLIGMFFLLLLVSACSSETISFEDESLEEVVLEELGMESEDVTEENLATIDSLDADNSNITNLEGIQSLQTLESLNLAGNEIEDLSPLSSLDQLENVHLGTVYITADENDTNWQTIEELEEQGLELDASVRLSFDEHEGPSEGVFYQVEEGDRTAYLLGSIHAGDEDLYPLHEDIETAFDSADHLAVEIDISDINEIESSQTIMQQGMYMDGSALSDQISEESYEEIVAYLSAFGIPEQMIDQFKPWFVSMMLAEVAMDQTNFTAEYGIDMYFMDKANEEDMPITSLESLEKQIEFLSSSPEEEQVDSLEATIAELDNYGEELTQMMRLWRSGNEEVFTELRNFDDGYDQIAMDERDLDMADQIEDFLTEPSNDEETYFIVVGALHLVGDESIVGLLEERGYDVVDGISN
ncbi:uncharacterized protein YbaP (TraB family) [Virgibacillus natechei]|uniref:Uncharacterized protein YbaP (TraB family) n=1 Tax=Virgibacillus natechei TaxID=1216297 RepID=A0ABS4II77_9BACI|nr:TraB/GumN family protein [Virgibacillus natechei]MBP1970663.1 uncharacterized protein YbaP (TraB family) [Virgibacillus natechei]UZD13951.1 TraB/GumN family protein [Virgibacillus natechei]